MSKSPAHSVIRLRGVRHNNLKNFDLDLPLKQLVVVTGLSGSGKSSLAFDTLFAEGQRRYIETFSPYARQFFDRMDKPQVDSIEGIPPAIAIEQRNAVRTTRSTVGTMTEICDHMKVLWPHIAQLHCKQCGQIVRKDSPQQIWETLAGKTSSRAEASQNTPSRALEHCEALITFDLPLSEKLPLDESLALLSRQGYQRILFDARIVRLEDAVQLITHRSSPVTFLTVVQDRVKILPATRARFIEACEQAYHFGKGKLAVRVGESKAGSAVQHPGAPPRRFSNRLHCAHCDIEYHEPSPALFSFNHPLGACPACKGFGRIISIDYNLAIPDRSLSLAEGAVRPWRGGFSAECQGDLTKFCKAMRVPMNVPFRELSAEHQRWVIEGDKDYGIDEDHQWPRLWYGVKGYFRWLEGKSYKMHVRVLLSRYRAYTKCPTCDGTRFQPEALLHKLGIDGPRSARESANEPSPAGRKSQITLADFYALPIRDALALVESFAHMQSAKSKTRKANDPITLVLSEIRSRLNFLNEVGLGYLTLDRPTRTLSGGETERVNLTTCLGTRLVNTLFILDEPSVGLHPRDTDRLVKILQQLRDAGNTLVVVEHEASVMRAADQILDIGPGHGATGGEIVFQGPLPGLLKSENSLTGQYLSGRKQIEIPRRRAVTARTPRLKLSEASRHNLKNLSVEIPLGRLVALTGVSGSGKTTLVREVLLPALEANLKSEIPESPPPAAKASDQIDEEKNSDSDGEHSSAQTTTAGLAGHEHIGQVILVDQSALGKTPRSNPAVYIGAFDDIREVFAQSEIAKQRGLNASAFSFNSAQGQCERCRGAGFEKIEMQFLSDVFIRCPDCGGRRYREHILEVKIAPDASAREFSIGDMLDATVDEAIGFLNGFASSKPAQRAVRSLNLLQEVGLGYLRLGQPVNTLSGGESQRLKLVSHLAAAQVESREPKAEGKNRGAGSGVRPLTIDARPALFLFDEPTTGLHFDDVRVLLKAFQRLADAGHSVLVIEHNLDVIKSADWVIDLGPDAGDLGGHVVAAGTPEEVAACRQSHTGRHLRQLLKTKTNLKSTT